MEKNKLLVIAVIALVLVNIVVLTFLWLGHQHRHKMGPPEAQQGRPPAAAFLIESLGLDDKQVSIYDHLRTAHHEKMLNLQTVLAEKREALFSGIALGDTSKIMGVSDVQRQMEMLTFAHFREVRTLCRPDQQPKFDQVIGEVLRLMANKMPPPRELEMRKE